MNRDITFKFGGIHINDGPFFSTDHKLSCVGMFSRDTCKTANVNHRHINDSKTTNIKDKNLKVYNM